MAGVLKFTMAKKPVQLRRVIQHFKIVMYILYVYARICMYMPVFACICVCVCVCTCICSCIYILEVFVFVFICIFMNICVL